MNKHGSIGGYLQTCDLVTESAEHEVWYARADAMITDVIEASFEHDWKLFPMSMRHIVLKTSIVD